VAKAIRIGVIGCGFYAESHLQSWRQLAGQGAVLSAVCDLDPVKAQKAGDAYGVPYFTDPARMLDHVKLDVVDIVTRHETHRTLCELAIGYGLAVIVQKPFATTLDDAFAIVTAARSAGTWLAVHENFRFQAPMRHVAHVLAGGEIGPPTWARIAFRTGFDVYMTEPYFLHEPRLAIADVGIHMLDLARAFMGEVTRISCETQSRKTGIAGEDTATMMLRHQSGAVSLVECTFQSQRDPDPFPETLLEIEGPNGTLQVHQGCRMTVTSAGQTRSADISAPLLPWTAHPWHVSQEGAFAACAHFLDCLQRGVPAATSGEDNLKTFALVDAAYRAAASHTAEAPARWSAT
jgi:D-apiose dehydrogenase